MQWLESEYLHHQGLCHWGALAKATIFVPPKLIQSVSVRARLKVWQWRLLRLFNKSAPRATVPKWLSLHLLSLPSRGRVGSATRHSTTMSLLTATQVPQGPHHSLSRKNTVSLSWVAPIVFRVGNFWCSIFSSCIGLDVFHFFLLDLLKSFFCEND